ncbi:hypothetical protein ACFO9E_02890 [Streptomyces maoxianensis]|uniref:Integral membrane protein n=1 Tax=Streptomyces maoxianensis TaxID=1459942 RepID=A0ABV9FY89_9ACTN
MRSFLSAVSAVLIVLVAVLTPLSALAVWADREIGDTDGYVAAMAPLASDPAVRNTVAVRITDEVMQKIDVGPFQEGVRNLLYEAVISFSGTDSYKNAWNTVNRAAHTAVEQALTSDTGNSVSMDLAPVIEEVKQQLSAEGLPFADQIPVERTRITILESDKLGVAREIFDGLRIAGVWLPVTTLLVAAAAVLLAVRRGRPRRALVARALIGLGIALAVGGVLLRIAVTLGRGLALDDLPPDLDRAAAGAVYDALTATLRTTAWWVLGAGLVLAAGAWSAGRLGGARERPEPASPPPRHEVTAEDRPFPR